MSIRTSPWPAGVPCWADLTVPDVPAARRFYSAVLGWEFADTDPEYGGYAIAQVSGSAAAGIGPLPQEGMPSAWTLYLSSPDVDALAPRIAQAGGTVILPPGDVGPAGRMLIAADPSGAAFGVWQAGDHIGAGIVNEPGGLTWEDLRSSDADAARAFYAEVFGFDIEPMPEADPDYALFKLAGEEAPLGGIGGLMGAEPPSHWLVYFAVADATAATEAAGDGGGAVLDAPYETPYGTMASIRDPFGAKLCLVQSDGSDQPDRTG